MPAAMPAVAAPAVSLLFAAAFALLNLWLAMRVGAARRARGVPLGHGGDALVEARMRAQANFVEYVPLALVLMALIELSGGRGTALWALGSLLALGRLLHPFGMERPYPNPLRGGGAACTLAATAALIGWALWIAFHPAGGSA